MYILYAVYGSCGCEMDYVYIKCGFTLLYASSILNKNTFNTASSASETASCWFHKKSAGRKSL